MNLLVLGGTRFLGRHVVDAALAADHTVTILNRGQHAPGQIPGVRQLIGDRNGDMRALHGEYFDAVIDCSAYTPDQIDRTLAALGPLTPHYVLISSISAYASFAPGRAYDESASLAQGHEGYGALKARSEEALTTALPGRAACVRPGLIVGPYDPTGRFTYWPIRIAQGGRILAPGRPERPIQFIDARDLAQWSLHLATQGIAGPFNAIGETLSMASFLRRCRSTIGSNAEFAWVHDAALLGAQITPWTELPLWIPEEDKDFGGMLLADNRRALAAGLVLRPIHETIADTLHWANSAPDLPPSPAITAEREAALLATIPMSSIA